jgi:hypothetical protein
VLRELVRKCALEAGEVVFEVREDALTVVDPERVPCEPTMLDAVTEDRAPEDDAFVFVDERLQVLEDAAFVSSVPGRQCRRPFSPTERKRAEPSSSGSRTFARTTLAISATGASTPC